MRPDNQATQSQFLTHFIHYLFLILILSVLLVSHKEIKWSFSSSWNSPSGAHYLGGACSKKNVFNIHTSTNRRHIIKIFVTAPIILHFFCALSTIYRVQSQYISLPTSRNIFTVFLNIEEKNLAKPEERRCGAWMNEQRSGDAAVPTLFAKEKRRIGITMTFNLCVDKYMCMHNVISNQHNNMLRSIFCLCTHYPKKNVANYFAIRV